MPTFLGSVRLKEKEKYTSPVRVDDSDDAELLQLEKYWGFSTQHIIQTESTHRKRLD